MTQHPESTTQYSGAELDGGARDVRRLGEVLKPLFGEGFEQRVDPEEMRRRVALARAREDVEFREQPPREVQ